MIIQRALLIFLATSLSLFGRTWWNPDRSKSFEGDFVSHDTVNVTILKKGKKPKEVTVAISRLHRDDQLWVKSQPSSTIGDPNAADIPDNNAAFETLHFGDTREVVVQKLKVSKLVESNLAEELTSRTGLNGLFRTKKKIGGYTYALYFSWSTQGTLTEVTLRSDPADESAYIGGFKDTWKSMVELLTMLHGKPVHKSPYPDNSSMENGLSLNSHLWRLEQGGSVLLGIGMESDKYILSARITKAVINARPKL